MGKIFMLYLGKNKDLSTVCLLTFAAEMVHSSEPSCCLLLIKYTYQGICFNPFILELQKAVLCYLAIFFTFKFWEEQSFSSF